MREEAVGDGLGEGLLSFNVNEVETRRTAMATFPNYRDRLASIKV